MVTVNGPAFLLRMIAALSYSRMANPMTSGTDVTEKGNGKTGSASGSRW